jgi:DNA-directed RNA polymerase subunit M/transcription elongation factor TFIIS
MAKRKRKRSRFDGTIRVRDREVVCVKCLSKFPNTKSLVQHLIVDEQVSLDRAIKLAEEAPHKHGERSTARDRDWVCPKCLATGTDGSGGLTVHLLRVHADDVSAKQAVQIAADSKTYKKETSYLKLSSK